MYYYTYVLQSTINKNLYVGYTHNLKNRIKLHNSGNVKSTKAYKPWVLIYYEAYRNRPDATKREKELKIHAAKNKLKLQIKNSLLK